MKVTMNYKETNLSGTSWTRCRCVTIVNPLTGGAPTAYFQEEKVISIDGAQTTVDAGSCGKAFNAGDAIPLLDPTTSNPTGSTVTHAELYAILYSLYMQTATARDAA